jgi:hypothetical protein
MRNKLNITEEESQRILNLHKNTILNENQNYTWKLVKSGGSGAVDKKGIFKNFINYFYSYSKNYISNIYLIKIYQSIFNFFL